MGRSLVALAGLMVSVIFLGGCAAPPMQNPFTLIRRINFMKPAEPSIAGEEAGEKKIAGNNPFRTRADAIAAREKALESRGGSKSSNATGQRKPSHDAELLALIEKELKDETPEEQERLYNEWKNLNPAMVRELIRTRRMVSQVVQNVPQEQPPSETRRESFGYGNQRFRSPTPNPAVNSFPGFGHGADMRYSAQLNGPPQFAGLGTNPWNSNYGSPPQQASYQGYSAPAMNAGFQNPQASYYENNYSQYPGGQAAPGVPGYSTNYRRDYPAVQPAGQTNAFQNGNPQVNRFGMMPGGQQVPAMQQQTPQMQAQSLQQSSGYSASHYPSMGMASPTLAFHDAGHPSAHTGNPNDGYAQQKSVPPSPSPPVNNGTSGYNTAGYNKSPLVITPNPGIGQPAGSENSPATTFASDWNGNLQKLVMQAQDSVSQLKLGTTPAEKKRYVERHVFLRMLYLMAGQQERALEPIPGLNSADQEFWQQVFWGVANYFSYESMPDASARATQTIAQLRLAIQKLQEEAELELRNVVFSRNIASFGNYTQFERDEFSPGQPVLVYAEVSNFKSEPTADGQYRTILKSTIQILTPGGQEVERMTFPATEDLCRNYRRDYFHSYEFTIPQQISLGPHVLKLTVEDQLKQKVASYTRNFTVR